MIRAAVIAQAAAMAFALSAAAADVHVVGPELWDRPRSAQTILAEAGVQKAARALASRPDLRLVIRHPPGQDGALQAEELRDWLVALAISPDRIVLRSGRQPGESLRLEVSP